MAILALLVVAMLTVGGVTLAGLLDRGTDAAAGGPATPSASAPPAPEDPAAEPGTATSSPSPSSPVPSGTPTASTAPSPAETTARASSAPSSAPEGCDPEAVVIVGETDRQAYAPGEEPVLSLVVRNEGATACTVNVGTSQMEFVLTSSDERIFSSTDCQQASQDLERTIEPGGEERARFTWSRDRSVPGCTTVEKEPEPGTYSLTTRLGARSSSPVEFTLQ